MPVAEKPLKCARPVVAPKSKEYREGAAFALAAGYSPTCYSGPRGRWFGRETGRGFAVEFFYVADTLVGASAQAVAA